MKFTTEAVYSAVTQPLIDSSALDGRRGGADWSSAARFSERGRTGRAVGYGRLERDGTGGIINDPAAADAARVGRGGSWAMRLSVPLNFDGSNATSQAPVVFDVAKAAGLQGEVYWGQELEPGSTGSILSHHNIQSDFPSMTNVEAKAIAGHIYSNATSEGDYSELFYRLAAIGDDLSSGCSFQAPPAAVTYPAWRNAFWPGAAPVPNYVGLLASFGRAERQYYLVGNRTNAYLTPGVIRALAAVQAANCNIAAGIGGRNGYCRSAQFGETLGLWCKGDGGPLYIDPGLPGGNVAQPVIADILEAIEWLRIVTGDDVGYSASCSAFTERLPFCELQRSCTGLGSEHRCAVPVPADVIARIDLMGLMWSSWVNGATDPNLPAAYNNMFGGGFPVPVAYPAGRDTTYNGTSAGFRGQDNARVWFTIVVRANALGGFANLAPELTRDELALCAAMVGFNRFPLLRLASASGGIQTFDRWIALGLPPDMTMRELITAVGSPSMRALPAIGLRLRTQCAASNGLSVWHTTIDSPAESLNPATKIVRGSLPPPREYFANLAIIAVFTRALADEVEASCGRCSHLTTLMEGGEPTAPGGAVGWTNDQLEHSAGVFCEREYRSGRAQLNSTRGARCLLWPALTPFVGSGERIHTCSAYGGQWNMAVCFSALQRECITGLPASVGGLIKNIQLFTYLYRKQPDFINGNVENSDLSRANRLHIVAAYAGLFGHSISLEYVVRYRTVEYGEYDEYTIPYGSIRGVRCEGSLLTDEIVTTLEWQRILPEQQIVFTGLDGITASDLITGKTRTRLVRAPGWLDDGVDPAEEDPAILCVGLAFGPTAPLLDNWRTKVALPPVPAIPAGGSVLRAVVDALAGGVSAARRLLHTGSAEVTRPWVCVKSAQFETKEAMQLMLNEAGANRAMVRLAEHAGFAAEAVSVDAQMAADRKRVDEEQQKPENAPEPQTAVQLESIYRKMEAMAAQLEQLGAAKELKGGAVDAQRPDAAEQSTISGLTEPTTASGGDGVKTDADDKDS